MSSDLDRQIDQLKRCEYLKESEVKALCTKAREILIEESNVQKIDAPVTVTLSHSMIRFAETFTASSMISLNSSKLEGSVQKPTTSSWETSLTGASTA